MALKNPDCISIRYIYIEREPKDMQEEYRLSIDVGWPKTFHAMDTEGAGALD